MSNEATIKAMLVHCRKIQTYSEGLDYRQFIASPMATEACVFNLLQLGEMVAKIDDAFIEQNPQIPWKAMKGMRHRLVHNYEGVDLEIVWGAIKNEVPGLADKLKKLFQDV